MEASECIDKYLIKQLKFIIIIVKFIYLLKKLILVSLLNVFKLFIFQMKISFKL